jgi:hypothetical protein
LIRNLNDLYHKAKQDKIEFEIQTHSVVSGGVAAICASKIGKFVYAAGKDGSIMIHAYGGEGYPN